MQKSFSVFTSLRHQRGTFLPSISVLIPIRCFYTSCWFDSLFFEKYQLIYKERLRSLLLLKHKALLSFVLSFNKQNRFPTNQFRISNSIWNCICSPVNTHLCISTKILLGLTPRHIYKNQILLTLKPLNVFF